jgi:Zn finger protein HypA/HybF involved in hydrogenase expression
MKQVFAWALGLVALVSLGNASTAFATESDYSYIGVKKCTMCHKKDDVGAQHKIWLGTKHATAFESLASEKSLEAAKAMGIDDPQADMRCLKCHATAANVMATLATEKIQLADGVACESCHGPGSGYYKKKTMKAIADGTTTGESVGLFNPTKETCIVCHEGDGNPFQKPFDYEKALAAIAHPIPE